MSIKTIYVSIDIESDGPCPGLHSMLALGAYAFRTDSDWSDTFTANLYPFEGAIQDPSTMQFWAGQPAAWEALQKERVHPRIAMQEFGAWIDELKKQGGVLAVAWPAGFDFSFVYWYSHWFLGKSPLGFTCFDIKSYAIGKLRLPYKGTGKRNLKEFLPTSTHTHIALDDAIEQGLLCRNLLLTT